MLCGPGSEECGLSSASGYLIQIDFSASYSSTCIVLFVDVVCSCACISSISYTENFVMNEALVSLE